jgi:hypothetical protein
LEKQFDKAAVGRTSSEKLPELELPRDWRLDRGAGHCPAASRSRRHDISPSFSKSVFLKKMRLRLLASCAAYGRFVVFRFCVSISVVLRYCVAPGKMGLPYSKEIHAAFDQVTPLVAAGFEVLQTTKDIAVLLAVIQVVTALSLILILLALIALLFTVNPDLEQERAQLVTPFMQWLASWVYKYGRLASYVVRIVFAVGVVVFAWSIWQGLATGHKDPTSEEDESDEKNNEDEDKSKETGKDGKDAKDTKTEK